MSVVRCALLVAAASLALNSSFTSVATAKSFAMSGQWFMNHGPFLDVPINGGAALCTTTGMIEAGCLGVFRPVNGGVPGSAVIPGVGHAPAAFTIPPHAFGQASGSQVVPFPLVPTIVQLATSFVFDGPADVTLAAAATPPFAASQPAKFQKNAWSKDPGQAGRAAANFAWCPGVGGPTCLSGQAATPTGVEGIVRYTAGANAFGGTMAMIVTGTPGTTTRIAIDTASTGPSKTLAFHVPIATGTGMNPRVGGAGYAAQHATAIPSLKFYKGFMTSTGMGSGLLTSVGPTFTTGGTAMAPILILADSTQQWGFPWTTGTISVMNTEMFGSLALTGTVTAMGADNRTPAGGGSIVLVAGGTTHQVVSGSDEEFIDVVVLNFDAGTPTPSVGPIGLGVLATVIALATGLALRPRATGGG